MQCGEQKKTAKKEQCVNGGKKKHHVPSIPSFMLSDSSEATEKTENLERML